MAKKRFKSGKRLPVGKAPSEKGLLRQSSEWQLLECLISADWQTPTTLTQVCIARQAPSGEIAAGVFLVDQACLGIKSAYGRIFTSTHQYRKELRNRMMGSQEMVSCKVAMAAKVIEEAIDYASDLGFKPDKDIKYAYYVMGQTDPGEFADLEVPVGGEDGKPLFIAGPYDDSNRIIRILNRKVGEGNYNYIMPISPDAEFFIDEDGDEDE